MVSFAHNSQTILIKPEADMILKANTKEAYGINMNMTICPRNNPNAQTCSYSDVTGNSELLFANLQANTEYDLILEHKNSIVQLSSFFDCPHVHFHLSMMSENQFQSLL